MINSIIVNQKNKRTRSEEKVELENGSQCFSRRQSGTNMRSHGLLSTNVYEVTVENPGKVHTNILCLRRKMHPDHGYSGMFGWSCNDLNNGNICLDTW